MTLTRLICLVVGAAGIAAVALIQPHDAVGTVGRFVVAGLSAYLVLSEVVNLFLPADEAALDEADEEVPI